MTKTTAKTPKTPKTPKTSEMPAWEMLCSILTGLNKTEAKARAEYDSLVAANPGKPFAPGIGPAYDVLNVTARTKVDLEFELRRVARSCGLSIPSTEAVDNE